MAELIQKVKELIGDSDMVLVGLGEEFSLDKVQLDKSSVYQHFIEKRTKENNSDDVEWLVEYIRNYYINNEMDLETYDIYLAYKRLFNIVKDKEYYIVNMNTDALLERAGFSSDRIVSPCGNKNIFQCSDNCSNIIWECPDIEKNIIQQILDEKVKLADIMRPKCEKCGKPAQYNIISKSNYCESGYLENWGKYREWSALTLNKKLCVIELGVGFKYPTVIRWPFEKIAFINNKAQFIRVNEKFEQVDEELANKSVSIKKNSINFLLSN
jgi:NAD-dependent SIR2 family protein deacetylase